MLRDRREYRHCVEHATGPPENPMTGAQLDEKFRVLAGDVLPSSEVETLFAALWDLDQADNFGDVVRLTRVANRMVRDCPR